MRFQLRTVIDLCRRLRVRRVAHQLLDVVDRRAGGGASVEPDARRSRLQISFGIPAALRTSLQTSWNVSSE
jgi:hypothetical protein